MALTQKLELRQSQSLVMTPQLMQAIKLLQLSSLDLAAYVEGELERNPLLERASEEAEPGVAEPEPSEAAREEATGAEDWFEQDLETSRVAVEDRLDTGLENVFPDDSGETPQRTAEPTPAAYSEWAAVGSGGHSGDYNLEAFVSTEKTLADHLAEQLMLAI